MKRKLLFFLLIVTCQLSFTQEKRKNIRGIIYNTVSNPVANSHIVNLSTNIGTISDDDGSFTIPVQSGDWIRISNIQYQTKKVRVKKGNINEGKLIIHLIPVTNVLEEAVIKKKLKGDLTSDMLKSQKDTIREKVESMLHIIKSMSHKAIMNMKIGEDERHMKKPRNAQLTTDPVAKAAGLPQATVGIPDGSSIRRKARRERLNFKERFPDKLKEMYGKKFFFNTLKIPKEKYIHFIEYCDPLGIEQLFKDEKHLEVIKILRRESISYLALIKENDK